MSFAAIPGFFTGNDDLPFSFLTAFLLNGRRGAVQGEPDTLFPKLRVLATVSTARINGVELLARAQDYVLDGIKVQYLSDFAAQRHTVSGRLAIRPAAEAFALARLF